LQMLETILTFVLKL